MFQLIGYMETFTAGGRTSHAVKRSHRLQIAERLIIEESAKVCKIAVVNKGHENGNEIHLVYNNGIVKVYNARTRRFITVLIARVPQIERYKIKVTKTMRKKINLHIKQGYNHIEFQEVQECLNINNKCNIFGIEKNRKGEYVIYKYDSNAMMKTDAVLWDEIFMWLEIEPFTSLKRCYDFMVSYINDLM